MADRRDVDARLSDVGASPPRFVGREREVADLADALANPPAVVLVEGEAGIGKSRLVQEFLDSPAGKKQRVLRSVCPPFRESLTLGPVVDAVRQARDGVAGLPLSALAGALRPLFPEWAVELPPSPESLEDAKASRHRLFRALLELIGAVDATVLVVEDVHWADEATLEFLLFLASGQSGHGLSLLVTYRPEDVPAKSLLLRLSSRRPAGTTQARISLTALDLAETAGLVSSMLDDEPVSEIFATFLHTHTDGVPLAVEESVRLLRHRSDLVRRDGEWVRRSLEDLQVPPTVRDSVLERFQRLSHKAQRVLEAAAVLAEPAAEAVLTAVSGLLPAQARAGQGEAVAAGMLGEDSRQRVAFRHALIGRAVYEATHGPRQRDLHLAAGHALEAVTPLPVVHLTRHFRAANEVEKWCQYAEQSAALAVSSGDHTTAVSLINNLLTTAELPPAVRTRLAGQLATAATLRREAVDELHRQVVHTLRTVLETTAMGQREEAEIRNRLSRLLLQLGSFDAATAELELAVPHLRHNPAEAARAMTSLGFPFAGPLPRTTHIKWLQRAAEHSANVTSAVDRLALAGDRASALLLLGEDSGWSVSAELGSEASNAEERCQVARGHMNIGHAAVVWGRYDEARERLATAMALAAVNDYERIQPNIMTTQAHLAWFTGAWRGLAEHVSALVEHDDLEPTVQLEAVVVAGHLHAVGGSVRRAEDEFRRVLDEAPRHSFAYLPLEPAAGLARLNLADGRVSDALKVTHNPIEMLTAKGIWIWATEILPVHIDALVLSGAVENARRLVSVFSRGMRDRRAPAPRAALATSRAILVEGMGDDARAAAAFARAARAWDRLPRPYDALLVRERQAGSLIAADRPETGLALLANVFQGLADLGALADSDRIADQLRGYGVEARRPWRGGRRGYGDQLSPRELEVVRLVVGGRTNRQIAEALSRSPNTVASQVNSAMRKLKVSSRTSLAVSAIEAGVALDD